VKKYGLDPEEPNSYRMISNLTFISKVIERVVAEQFKEYPGTCSLLPSVQSAFHQTHSSAEVISDILDAADSQEVTLLGLLYMSTRTPLTTRSPAPA